LACHHKTLKSSRNVEVMKYVVLFDMDGVLTPQAQALQLAKALGKTNEAMKVFSGQMRKQIGLEWILSRGSMFLKGQDPSILENTAKKMLITKSAKSTIEQLKEASYHPVIVTNGFEEMAQAFGKRIGITEAYGNSPEVKGGVLTGKLSDSKLLTVKSKGDFIRKYLKDKGIAKKDAVAVGNDENDMAMFQEVGLTIAFNPSRFIKSSITDSFSKAIDGKRKDFIKFTNVVDIVILNNDLSKLLPFLIPKPDKFSSNVKIDEKTQL